MSARKSLLMSRGLICGHEGHSQRAKGIEESRCLLADWIGSGLQLCCVQLMASSPPAFPVQSLGSLVAILLCFYSHQSSKPVSHRILICRQELTLSGPSGKHMWVLKLLGQGKGKECWG